MNAASASLFAIQRADERGHSDHGWLRTAYSFSFADYYDPQYEHWGALRVLNDDRIAPAAGFPPHPHRDMEIVTYVLSGELAHQDSMGNRGVVGPGGVQFMSAGTGVRHAEFNNSATEPLHLVQMWVIPAETGTPPSYGQQSFTTQDRTNRLLTIVSGEPDVAAPIRITQLATLMVSRLDNASVVHRFQPGRYGFAFVAGGALSINGEGLETGDAVRSYGIESLTLEGTGEAVLWDLPALP